MASFDFIFARANFCSDSLTALGSLCRKKRLTMAPARDNEWTVLRRGGRGCNGVGAGSWNFQTLRGKLAAAQIKDDKKISLSTLSADGKVLQQKDREGE